MQPTIRLGHISKTSTEWGFIVSSSKMEPGDSGGPLFDLNGKIIAMHSRVDVPLESNFEVPIDLYKKYWNSLEKEENYKTLPDSLVEIKKCISKTKSFSLNEKQLPANTIEAIKRSSAFCYTIHNGKEEISSALTIFNPGAFSSSGINFRHSFLIGKSSILGDSPMVKINGQKIDVKILFRDVKTDLVILSSALDSEGLSLENGNKYLPLGFSDLGEMLFSLAKPDSLRFGVLGSLSVNQPKRFSSGVTGLVLALREGKMIVSRILAGSSSENAGVQVGDELVALNGDAVKNIQDYNNEISQFDPGARIDITIGRNDTVLTFRLLLDSKKLNDKHPAYQFAGGRSIRSDGFKKVFIHDGPVEPKECGGALFDINGKFYGINIARFSRTATLALPYSEILDFIVLASKSSVVKSAIL